MRTTRWQSLIAATLLASSVLSAGRVSACPNCKETVSAQPAEVANMARGYNWSILVMLGVPATMLCTGAFAVRRAVKLGTLPEL
jgi:hypothetical protein